MTHPWHYGDESLLIRKVCVGPLENNAYVVACAATGNAVLIDAAAEADRLVAALADLRPQAIVTTHGHWDHVQAATEVSSRLQIPFRIHQADAAQFDLTTDAPLTPGTIPVGRLTIEAIATPGHTPGSTCFSVSGDSAPGVLFSGDTLFPGGPGATADAAAFATIMDSLERELFTLPDETIVMPGHGLNTTIGTERPNLPLWQQRGW